MVRRSAPALLAAGTLALALFGCTDGLTLSDASSPTAADHMTPAIPTEDAVPGRYIVRLEARNVAVSEMAKSVQSLEARYPDIEVGNVYSGVFRGFSARIPEARLRMLLSDPAIAAIEPDRIVRACSSETFQTLDWGISYIGGDSSIAASGDGRGTVTGVEVYVVDTGIDLHHPDLNVAGGVNVANPYVARTNYDDDNGHGTHVAGIIGAEDNDRYVVGVAPGVPLYAVKVLTAQGYGTLSGILEGLDWILARKAASPKMPMVVNMSIACAGSDAFDAAVGGLITAGITVVAAAGNDSMLASQRSPGRVPGAITVGAIGPDGRLAGFSDYGSAVDLLAPGVNILSTWIGGTVRTASGTSSAAPMAAGAAALYLAQRGNSGRSPSQVESALARAAGAWARAVPFATTNRVLRIAQSIGGGPLGLARSRRHDL